MQADIIEKLQTKYGPLSSKELQKLLNKELAKEISFIPIPKCPKEIKERFKV